MARDNRGFLRNAERPRKQRSVRTVTMRVPGSGDITSDAPIYEGHDSLSARHAADEIERAFGRGPAKRHQFEK